MISELKIQYIYKKSILIYIILKIDYELYFCKYKLDVMNKKLNTNFYKNVAKLFYAIAAVDKVIKEEEFTALKKIVKKEWLTLDESEDEYSTDAAYQIEFVFEGLQFKGLDAYDCYNEFIEYKNKHSYFFTDQLNSLIMKTADKIASSYAGKNKSELIMLAKLDLNLKTKTS